jgi:hypothetical protein
LGTAFTYQTRPCATGTTTRVPVASDAKQENLWSGVASTSSDRRYGAFECDTSNLVQLWRQITVWQTENT